MAWSSRKGSRRCSRKPGPSPDATFEERFNVGRSLTDHDISAEDGRLLACEVRRLEASGCVDVADDGVEPAAPGVHDGGGLSVDVFGDGDVVAHLCAAAGHGPRAGWEGMGRSVTGSCGFGSWGMSVAAAVASIAG